MGRSENWSDERVDQRNEVVGQKWKKSGSEKWGWIGEKWADRSEKRKKKTHHKRRLNQSLDREHRVRWCRLERRLDRSLIRRVRGVDRSLFVDRNLFPRVRGVDRSLFHRVLGVDRSLLRRLCGVDRSLAVSTASSLDRGASVWIVSFGSVCGSK